MGFRYLPAAEHIPPCPRCGDRERVSVIVVGEPAFAPSDDERDRVTFVGCEGGDDMPTDGWWCPSCREAYP